MAQILKGLDLKVSTTSLGGGGMFLLCRNGEEMAT